ncbi:regulator of sigma E protease [Sulfuritortus calidifontis]|uniref:Zinc metalloprotease n=1 Tax=Sulfuritortus calidifontis TaxID=1914471 RepID=A0A4V2UQK2_9PROT|nr:RIP metalloprotease RseP [Sulfuritortus calidifontis]TCS71133.1 regulator of sigma E protease [Sulfuritortus calidifontis]
MTTLLAFLVTLAILIVVHEFGHYSVARLMGVKVLRFSVGFGQVIARRQDRHGTEWALSAIPMGGYVKMLDEREGEVAEQDLPYAFNRQNVWKRSAIVFAGPAANLLLAILIYWGLFFSGVPALKPILGEPPAGTPAYIAGIRSGETVLSVNDEKVESWQDLHWSLLRHGLGAERLSLETRDNADHLHFRQLDLSGLAPDVKETDPARAAGLTRYIPAIAPVLGEVVAGGQAALAGLRVGDRILSVDGVAVANWHELVQKVRSAPGQALTFELARQGQVLRVNVTPTAADEAGQRVGKIGAAPQIPPGTFEALQTQVRYSAGDAVVRALAKTWELSSFSLEMLGRMVIGQASLDNIAGPITIADYAGQSARSGIASFIAFLALISISLAVLNLLPIPLLDGGHLLYYLVEVVTGRPVPERVQEIGQRIGMALLGVLMFFALFNDLQRLLTQ